MSKIFGVMSREDRQRMVTLGSEESLRIRVNVGNMNNSKEIVDMGVSVIGKDQFRVVFNGKAIKEMLVENSIGGKKDE